MKSKSGELMADGIEFLEEFGPPFSVDSNPDICSIN